MASTSSAPSNNSFKFNEPSQTTAANSKIQQYSNDKNSIQTNLQNIAVFFDDATKRTKKPPRTTSRWTSNVQPNLPLRPTVTVPISPLQCHPPCITSLSDRSLVFKSIVSCPNPISQHNTLTKDPSSHVLLASSPNTNFLDFLLPPKPQLPASDSPIIPISVSSSPAVVSSVSAVSAPGPSSAPIGPCYTLNNRIALTLCGEEVSFDLQLLEPDPKGVIELLTSTLSERGTWILVGAHYRRRGNPSAALAVVTAMLDVMKSCDIPASELKPAYLFLSGCETDLAKSRSGNTSEHQKKSQEWLRKVYGSHSTPVLTKAMPITAVVSKPSHSDPERDSRRTSISSTSRPPPRDAASSHERILEREIQSLRDRQVSHAGEISRERTVKRKLEDEITYERDVRRKLEKQIMDLKKERDHVKKMEGFAQDQVKREVETRRKAEDRAEREREMRIQAQGESRGGSPVVFKV